MKASATCLQAVLFLCSAAAACAGDFIRQIQNVNGNSLIYDIPITGDNGTALSQPLLSEAVTFQLYTTHTNADNQQALLKLDEKMMGSYLPAASVEILSEDPHVPARTRADQPYGIRVTVSGMQSGATVPDHVKSVKMVRSYALYDDKTYAPSGASGEYADAHTILQNGTYTAGVSQRLPGDSPTKAVGEESFTIYTMNSSGVLQGQLSKATVKIWPVATAAFDGIEAGRVYTEAPRHGEVMMNDIYPGATVYAQIYPGPEKLGTKGSELFYLPYPKETAVPQNQAMDLSNLSQYLSADGDYTVEVLTITPFNEGKPERLAHLTFSLKRSMRVNGTVSTME